MKQDYIKELLAQAKAAGIEAAEAYLSEKENFSAMRNNGARWRIINPTTPGGWASGGW